MADVIVYDYLSNAESSSGPSPAPRKSTPAKSRRTTPFPRANQPAPHRQGEGGQDRDPAEGRRPAHLRTRRRGGRGTPRRRHSFEIVPGISSSIAGPAYAGIPVTHRSHCTQLTIFTGHEDPTKEESSLDYAQIAKAPGTKVMLMGVERLPIITAAILKEGGDPELPVALVRWATTASSAPSPAPSPPSPRSPSARISSPRRRRLRHRRELPEKAELVRGASPPRQTHRRHPHPSPGLGLTAASATSGPTSSRCPRSASNPSQGEEAREFARMVVDAHTYEWIIFTSPNAVEYFFDAFYKIRNRTERRPPRSAAPASPRRTRHRREAEGIPHGH